MTRTGTLVWYWRASCTTRSRCLAADSSSSTPWLVTSLRALPTQVSRKRGTSNLTALYVFVRYLSSSLPPTDPVSPKMPAYLLKMYGVQTHA